MKYFIIVIIIIKILFQFLQTNAQHRIFLFFCKKFYKDLNTSDHKKSCETFTLQSSASDTYAKCNA